MAVRSLARDGAPLRRRAHRPRLPRRGKRGPVWYAKYRLPDGRQVQRKLGPAWTERGPPAGGLLHEAPGRGWLRDVLDQARRGTLPGLVRTGATVADAAAEFLRYIEHDRERKPSTVKGYRWIVNARSCPRFGEMRSRTSRASTSSAGSPRCGGKPSSRRKALVCCTGSSSGRARCYGLAAQPRQRRREAAAAPQRRHRGVLPRGGLGARARRRLEQDGAIFLTAAFTGLRMGELIALRWRDVDFAGSVIRVRASYAGGALTTPKSGKVRSVPLAPDVATALAQLGRARAFTATTTSCSPATPALPGRLGAAPPLQGRARARRPAAAALPRPAPHVRHADDRQGRHPPRAGVDGPCRHPDDDELPALRAAAGGRAAGGGGVSGRGGS